MPSNLILHARFATQGEPNNNQNNHPLYSKVSGLCMVHNGWFLNDYDIREQFSLKPDAEVDTEVYLRLIEKFYIEGDVKSIETAIKEATKCVFGNIACAMIQGGKEGTLWLWRDRGDLYLIKTEWGYVFASTKKILTNAIGCLTAFDLASWEQLYIPPSTLVKLELDKKPRFVKLEPIEYLNSQYENNISVTTINGEEKIRRKSSSGITRYYYGNTNNAANRTYFNGYQANKGYYLPRVSTPKSQSSNNREKEASNKTIFARPENHHIQCQCKICTEYWYSQSNDMTVYD